MPHKLPNYLRTHRKRAGLTQDEVAYLLGCRDGAKVSCHERFTRQPSLETLFAYQVIFQSPARELFAGVFRKVERRTSGRVRVLLRKLNRKTPDRLTAQKVGFLRTISSRTDATDPEHPS